MVKKKFNKHKIQGISLLVMALIIIMNNFLPSIFTNSFIFWATLIVLIGNGIMEVW